MLRESPSGPEEQGGWTEGTLEAPFTRLGVNHLKMYDESTIEARYGSWTQVFLDVLKTGAGTLRHPKGRDLVWQDLFPGDGSGEVVPPPAEIFDRMTATTEWGACGLIQERFGPLLLACILGGVQVTPTLWCYGSGENTLSNLPDEIKAAILRLPYGENQYVLAEAGWDPLVGERRPGFLGAEPEVVHVQGAGRRGLQPGGG